VKDSAGRTVKSFKGSHRTAGIYAVVVETAGLQPGEYSVEGTVTYTAAGRENTIIVTKQLTVNSPFPVQLVAVSALVVIAMVALVALRRRKKTR
jgi:membrane protein implicated in regulation of membrane protease activity